MVEGATTSITFDFACMGLITLFRALAAVGEEEQGAGDDVQDVEDDAREDCEEWVEGEMFSSGRPRATTTGLFLYLAKASSACLRVG